VESSRAAGAAGVVAAVAFLAAFALLATPPEPGDPAREIAAYLEGHRGRILLAAALLGAGSCLFGWYLAGVLRMLGGGAVPGVLAAATAAVLVVVAMSSLAGVVLHPPAPPLAMVGLDVFNALVTMGGFGFGFSLIVFAAAGGLPRAHRAGGYAIGALQLATIPGLAVEHGFFAPLGPMALLAFWALTAWYAAVAVRLLRA
jgi:hypothetical protein